MSRIPQPQLGRHPFDRRTLEIAVESVSEAVAARNAGANRLELCAALDVGGLTPSISMLGEVVRAAGIPVLAMIRPRPGGFVYSPVELAVMRADSSAALAAGACGVVFGALRPDFTLDVDACRALAEHARAAHGGGAIQLVFHRAFDLLPDPFSALEQLVELGVTRILTSGGQPSSATRDARERLTKLITLAAGRIEILPAGGVRAENVAELVRAAGCTQIHAACRAARVDPSLPAAAPLAAAFTSPAAPGSIGGMDADAVASLRRALDELRESRAP